MRTFLPIYIINFVLTSILLLTCKTNPSQDPQPPTPKQKGAHLFGRVQDTLSLQGLLKNNMEWVTYVPWGSQKDYDSSKTGGRPHKDSLDLIRHENYWRNKIELAHQVGLKVFLKPHIWIHDASNGKWRSDIFPTNDENWETWKSGYREFILSYAHIAEKNNVELFCIGTEFTRLTIEKPEFWETLIKDVRNIYSGKITYAANWYKEFEKVTFWDQLDFIGIQAYFPLVKNTNPTVEQISKGWEKHILSIESIHQKFNKKILFSELGYKSTPESAIEPWTWIDYSNEIELPISMETQVNCYKAFFNTIWKKDWMAGVHLWQFRVEHETTGGMKSRDFTPQNKPAEKVIAKGFGGK